MVLAELENRRSYRSVANVSADGRQNEPGRKTRTIVESRVLKREIFFLLTVKRITVVQIRELVYFG